MALRILAGEAQDSRGSLRSHRRSPPRQAEVMSVFRERFSGPGGQFARRPTGSSRACLTGANTPYLNGGTLRETGHRENAECV